MAGFSHKTGVGVSRLALGVCLLAGPVAAQEAPPLASEAAYDNLLTQMMRNGVLSPAAAASMRRQRALEAAAGARAPAPAAFEPPPAPPTSATQATAPAPARGIGSLPVADNGPAPPSSGSMVVNLMRLLVKQGVISQTAADALRQEAEASADQERMATAAPTSGGAAPLLASQSPPPAGIIRVPYIPQVVRNQIKDDIKKDVLAQAQAEGWANSKALPTWLGQVRFFGDLRFRDEYDLYSSNNVSQFIDYNALNNSGPVDINANTNPNGLPFINTRQNRYDQLSIRARFGVSFQPADWVALTFRLGSGQDTGPVSNTQLLGGGLTKKNIWLDQAYLTLSPANIGSFSFGRMPDFFMHTDLLFDDNLEFDGALALADKPVGNDGLRVFGAAGVFPLGYVSGAFPSNFSTKSPDSTKWLFAAQAGAQYKPTDSGWSIRAAAAFYDYDNVEGQESAPCAVYEDASSSASQCTTDQSRPNSMQKGNTLFLIRNIIPNPSSPLNYAQPQFAGLAYNYHELDGVAEFETPMFGNLRALLTADYVRNLAYDPGRLLAAAAANPLLSPVTNYNTSANSGKGAYQSGPNAFNVRLMVGNLRPSAAGDWNFQMGYKYIEPDAVIDAFNGNDFHMGGTNAKGYYLIANYYFARNTWIDGRWFSATEVFGPPLSIDVLQLELQTRF